MTELSNLLRNLGTLDEQAADTIRDTVEASLNVPDRMELKDDEPTISADGSEDWIIAEIEVNPDRVIEIYALAGAYTLQMYDGETFREPTTSVEELNQQLASI